MPSLTSGLRLGTGSASSLLRSATATATAASDYQDKLMAFNYANSAKTPDDWKTYSDYLSSRITKLNATGLLSDASKGLSLTSTYQTSQKSYISSTIQRASMDVLTGNGTLQDKNNVIAGFIDAANQNGDAGLAQSLTARYLANDQTIQYQRQVAADQQAALEKSTGAANAANVNALANSLEHGLNSFTQAFKQAGEGNYANAAKAWLDAPSPAGGSSNRDMINALLQKEGQAKLPDGALPSPGQLTQDIIQTISTLHHMQGDILMPTDPYSAQSAYDRANAIDTNVTKFDTIYGNSLSHQDIVDINNSPLHLTAKETYNSKTGQSQWEYVAPQTVGFAFDKNGQLQPIAGNAQTGYEQAGPKDQARIKAELQKLGFGTDKGQIDFKDNGMVSVRLTDQTGKWLTQSNLKLDPNQQQITLVPTGQGYQVVPYYGTDGKKHDFTIAIDKRGLGGLYETQANGTVTHIQGQYGFDQGANKLAGGIKGPGMQPFNINDLLKGGGLNQQNMKAMDVIAKQNPQEVRTTLNGVNYNFAGDVINKVSKPQMIQRAGGGFNFVDANGAPISAYTYAKQTGQTFRGVLSSAAAKGDTYAAQALNYAGNDAAYNPATVPLGVAQNWTSLTWGNQVNLQTPQASRTASGMPGFSLNSLGLK